MNISQLNGRIDDLESVMGGVPSDSVPFSIGGQSLSGGGNMDYSDFAFGFSINGAVVTYNSGEIQDHGTRTVVTCAGGDRTISVDLQYVWVEYTFGGTATIALPSTVRPATTETVLRVWLGLFNLSDGVVTLNQIGHLGNISIPGVFA